MLPVYFGLATLHQLRLSFVGFCDLVPRIHVTLVLWSLVAWDLGYFSHLWLGTLDTLVTCGPPQSSCSTELGWVALRRPNWTIYGPQRSLDCTNNDRGGKCNFWPNLHECREIFSAFSSMPGFENPSRSLTNQWSKFARHEIISKQLHRGQFGDPIGPFMGQNLSNLCSIQ